MSHGKGWGRTTTFFYFLNNSYTVEAIFATECSHLLDKHYEKGTGTYPVKLILCHEWFTKSYSSGIRKSSLTKPCYHSNWTGILSRLASLKGQCQYGGGGGGVSNGGAIIIENWNIVFFYEIDIHHPPGRWNTYQIRIALLRQSGDQVPCWQWFVPVRKPHATRAGVRACIGAWAMEQIHLVFGFVKSVKMSVSKRCN